MRDLHDDNFFAAWHDRRIHVDVQDGATVITQGVRQWVFPTNRPLSSGEERLREELLEAHRRQLELP